MKISNATSADSEAINHVYFDTWVSTYPNPEKGITKEDLEEWLQSSITAETVESHKRWLNALPLDLQVLVAKEEEKVIGFCYVKRGDANGHNKLRAIYVLPAYQGKGVGTALWSKAQEFLNPDIDTDVEVVEYNADTIEFYKKIGFVDTGKRVVDNEDFRLSNGIILPLAYMVLLARK